MYLSDQDIEKAVKNGDIVIHDFTTKRLQPASYDILLGNKFIITDSNKTHFIDPVKKVMPVTHELILKDDEEFILHPGVSVLGTSHDFFGSQKYLIHLSGKSSLARIGLVVHNTAGLINPGHFLHITFELCNLNSVPIVLHPKMPIAQLLFSALSSDVKVSYLKTGHHHGDNWQKNFASFNKKVSSRKVIKKSAKKVVIKK